MSKEVEVHYAHKFNDVTYDYVTYCDVCDQELEGYVRQGQQCFRQLLSVNYLQLNILSSNKHQNYVNGLTSSQYFIYNQKEFVYKMFILGQVLEFEAS